MTKPIIYYVDDEQEQLDIAAEVIDCETYDLKLFDNAGKALHDIIISEKKPSAIFSDQMMPGLDGISFLAAIKDIKDCKHTKLFIVTASDDKDTWKKLLQAGILFGFITKPYDPFVLQQEVKKGVDAFKLEQKILSDSKIIKAQKKDLELKNMSLNESNEALKMKHEELVQWVHPLIFSSIENNTSLPDFIPITGVTFDVIDGSKTSGQLIDSSSLHSYLTKLFTAEIIKYGGWQESQSGDSAFGHFHINEDFDAFEAALAAARAFRTQVINLNNTRDLDIKVGIGVHYIPRAKFDVNSAESENIHKKTIIRQKYFTTSSIEIDRLHRIESHAHVLMNREGINILMSDTFYDKLKSPPESAKSLGKVLLPGQKDKVGIYILPDFEAKLRKLDKSS